MCPTSNTFGTACSNRPRPWPVAPRPFDGEAFGGWLGRLTGKYYMTVEQLWTHADLGPMPILTQGKCLLCPPVQFETLERLSQLTHVRVDPLRAMQAPIGWIYEGRFLRYCYPCLILNCADVCAPFWKRPVPRQNSFGTLSSMELDGQTFPIHYLRALAHQGFAIDRIPYSLRVLLEIPLRNEDGRSITAGHVRALIDRAAGSAAAPEILFHPGLVLMQDHTGLAALSDLAALRDAVTRQGGDPTRVNPLARRYSATASQFAGV